MKSYSVRRQELKPVVRLLSYTTSSNILFSPVGHMYFTMTLCESDGESGRLETLNLDSAIKSSD